MDDVTHSCLPAGIAMHVEHTPPSSPRALSESRRARSRSPFATLTRTTSGTLRLEVLLRTWRFYECNSTASPRDG